MTEPEERKAFWLSQPFEAKQAEARLARGKPLPVKIIELSTRGSPSPILEGTKAYAARPDQA